MMNSRILWGKCANSAETNLFEQPCPRSWTVGMAVAQPDEFLVYKNCLENERKELVFGVPEGYGNGLVDHMEMVGKESKLGYPLPSVLCCRTLLKYLLQQRYRDVLDKFLKCPLQSRSWDAISTKNISSLLHAISTRETILPLLPSLVRIVITFLMVCEYNSNVLTALTLAIYLARPGGLRQMKKELATSMRARNVFPVSCLQGYGR